MKGVGRLISRALPHRQTCRSTSPSQLISRRLIFSSSRTPSFLRVGNSSSILSSNSELSASLLPLEWNHLEVVQRRSVFIQTQSTPNPWSLMFYPGEAVMEVGSADFPNARSAMNSPLAKALYEIDGITRVFFGSDFITVTKSDDASWDLLKTEIFAAIMEFYSSGQPLFLDSTTATSKDTAIHELYCHIFKALKKAQIK
ncbi:NifU-like protein 5 [Hibiscus syriacus]|uniref:NifU-like protein 5 n=1 Tax=Hibiscus syriacus TaxID=106335 RepID=A0A6A3BGI4_HIBSY|nr:NifU-like protein 5 [Hibiscus syriacus]